MKDGRVVTANLPEEMVARMDLWAERMERSKSWIIKQAVGEWLAEEDRRHQMTLEGLADIDAGRVHSHEEIRKWAEEVKGEARERREKLESD